MTQTGNPNAFANSPLTRLNNEVGQDERIKAYLDDPGSLLAVLWRGDPLVTGDKAAFLSAAALPELPADAPTVMLGLKDGVAYFGIDVSSAAGAPEDAPFAEIGAYLPIREAAGAIDRGDLAIIGHARWLFEWHRNHRHCGRCGAPTRPTNGGAKRQCDECEAEHFPRSDPVAIVLALHGDACLLGRGPHFPPGMLSALAGFVEAGESPEEAARREIFEEVGVRLGAVDYQFSQPWPFPSSLMMGFLADAADRALALDIREIEEARWIERPDIIRLLNGEAHDGVVLPPDFTIAGQLIRKWAAD